MVTGKNYRWDDGIHKNLVRSGGKIAFKQDCCCTEEEGCCVDFGEFITYRIIIRSIKEWTYEDRFRVGGEFQPWGVGPPMDRCVCVDFTDVMAYDSETCTWKDATGGAGQCMTNFTAEFACDAIEFTGTGSSQEDNFCPAFEGGECDTHYWLRINDGDWLEALSSTVPGCYKCECWCAEFDITDLMSNLGTCCTDRDNAAMPASSLKVYLILGNQSTPQYMCTSKCRCDPQIYPNIRYCDAGEGENLINAITFPGVWTWANADQFLSQDERCEYCQPDRLIGNLNDVIPSYVPCAHVFDLRMYPKYDDGCDEIYTSYTWSQSGYCVFTNNSSMTQRCTDQDSWEVEIGPFDFDECVDDDGFTCDAIQPCSACPESYTIYLTCGDAPAAGVMPEIRDVRIEINGEGSMGAAKLKITKLGDILAKRFERIGIKPVAGCPCKRLQKKLNTMTPEALMSDLHGWAVRLRKSAKKWKELKGGAWSIIPTPPLWLCKRILEDVAKEAKGLISEELLTCREPP